MTHSSHVDGGVDGACPDLDTLADLHADALDAPTARTVRAHVATCSDCQAVLNALDTTVSSLSSMPEVPLPQSVAERIDAALAAESGRVGLHDDRSVAASRPAVATGDRRLDTEPTAHTNVASLDAHRQKRGLSRGRMLLAAAAAAVVVGGGAFALGQAGGDNDTTAADEQQTSEPAEQEPGASNEVRTFAEPKDVLEDGTIVNDQVSEEVAGEMAEKSARLQCLNLIVPRPGSAPEAVQEGTHDGKDAYAFIFPTDDPDEIHMIVVDANNCGEVLYEVDGPRE
ncbi:MAG: anti-sigma factor family protein [Cumulibacter sp.]